MIINSIEECDLEKRDEIIIKTILTSFVEHLNQKRHIRNL